jgi:hypothetical protein
LKKTPLNVMWEVLTRICRRIHSGKLHFSHMRPNHAFSPAWIQSCAR